MIAWIFFLLALRSTVLACQKGKPAKLRIVDGSLAALSLVLFLLLPRQFEWQPLAVIAAIMGILVYRRMTGTVKNFSLTSLLGWTSVYALGAFLAAACNVFKLAENQKVAKVILTGKTERQWISWRNPSQIQDEGTWMDCYEVVVQDLEGKELSRNYVYGDLVAIRAEVLTIHWPFQLLGFSNLCHLETVHNGYATSARHNFFPHVAHALPFSLPFFRHFWEGFYHGKWKIPGIKTASLESAYLPLTSPQVYLLVLGNSGITAEPYETTDHLQ